VESLDKWKEAIESISPYPISYGETRREGANGYCSYTDKKIVIRKDLPALQTVKTMIHEVAHALLHCDVDDDKSRKAKEIEAESVAYTVAKYYGLDTSDYSFGYVVGWGGSRTTEELKSSMEIIKATATGIINDLDSKFGFGKKEVAA
jgi:Zn-dependent peptidase ImmA (M78 family)